MKNVLTHETEILKNHKLKDSCVKVTTVLLNSNK